MCVSRSRSPALGVQAAPRAGAGSAALPGCAPGGRLRLNPLNGLFVNVCQYSALVFLKLHVNFRLSKRKAFFTVFIQSGPSLICSIIVYNRWRSGFFTMIFGLNKYLLCMCHRIISVRRFLHPSPEVRLHSRSFRRPAREPRSIQLSDNGATDYRFSPCSASAFDGYRLFRALALFRCSVRRVACRSITPLFGFQRSCVPHRLQVKDTIFVR